MQFNIFRAFALAGTGLTILAIFLSALTYRGQQGEHFSLFRYFISELGEVGVSRRARLFNFGLILGGLFLLPYIVDLGFIFKSLLGWLGVAAGAVAALGVVGVGLFPINDLASHRIAAMTFFRAGLVMVTLFGLAILFQPAGRATIPQAANLLSLPTFTAYASFLVLMTPKKKPDQPDDSLEPEQVPQRPKFWLLPIVEWAVFFTTILWLFGMAFLI
jgi:hypothetical membrane protein